MVKTCPKCGKEFKKNGLLFHEPGCRGKLPMGKLPMDRQKLPMNKLPMIGKEIAYDREENKTSNSKPMDREGKLPMDSYDRENREIAYDREEKSKPMDRQKIQEVNLMEEFEKNKEKIEPKKEEKTKEFEANYKCGSCQSEFYHKSRPKNCPDCGVEV